MISEEQRQALIAFNRAIIAQHEAYAVPESRWPDDVRMLVKSARIALASLEAEKAELPSIFDAFTSQTGWQRGFVDGQIEYRHEIEGLGDLYTAPPVPVMRPVEIPAFDGYKPHIVRELQAAFTQAIRAAGGEVAG